MSDYLIIASQVGSFLAGAATTIGLVAIWIQWDKHRNDKKTQSELENKFRLQEQNRQDEHLNKIETLQNISHRREAINLELQIISWAHEAYSDMAKVRGNLYLKAFSKGKNDQRYRNYAIILASRTNLIFGHRLSSWISALAELESREIDIRQINQLVELWSNLAREDGKLLSNLSSEQLEELKKEADANNMDGFWEKNKTSDEFDISPNKYNKALESLISEIENSLTALQNT